jgi:PLP dependent protein
VSATPHPALAAVTERLAAACRRAGREPGAVALVAVTKGRSPDEVRALLDAGQRVLAENRVQDWRALVDALGDDVPTAPPPRWHLIGHLQRNKVRFCRPFDLIHSLDSARLARALDEEGAKHEHVFRALVQVNVSGEASKYGVAPADLAALLDQVAALEHVRVEGLMTMAPFDPDPERARPVFAALRSLAQRHGLRELSMGMSGDFEVAVEEGATLVRIGSALFEGASAAHADDAQPGMASTASTST